MLLTDVIKRSIVQRSKHLFIKLCDESIYLLILRYTIKQNVPVSILPSHVRFLFRKFVSNKYDSSVKRYNPDVKAMTAICNSKNYSCGAAYPLILETDVINRVCQI